MLPKENYKKIKTFKSMNPLKDKLDREVLDIFLIQQQDILKLLDQSKNLNLSKVKASISIARWIKLKLGDTLRVLIYHNYRHVKQAQRCLEISPV